MLPLRASLAIFLLISTVYGLAGQQPAQPRKLLWMDPGAPETFDFQYGSGGRDQEPQPPFRFLSEDTSMTTPKVNVVDGRGVTWNVKWGNEARPSAFCTRLVRACGYFAETEYFLAAGRIEGSRELRRAKAHIGRDGSFVDARFQLRSSSPKFLRDEQWKLSDNPFVGAPELQGLKILLLLLSNWDNRKANFGVFSDDRADEHRELYVPIDWGAAMGAWGNYFSRTKGKCKDFARQSAQFVKGADQGLIKWGFGSFDDIRASDAQWLLQYLGRITDEQIRIGLISSGETPEDTDCYALALRQRIQQLQRAAGGAPSASRAATSAAAEIYGLRVFEKPFRLFVTER